MKADFQVGSCLVAPSRNIVRREGKNIRLEPKVMQVLVCLADHAGEVVTKEQLIRTVWADTFVTDDVLKRCVSQLRKAFNDNAKEPKAIETIAKGGYRLLLNVTTIDQHSLSFNERRTTAFLPRRVWLSAGVLLLGALLAVLLLVLGRRTKESAWHVEPVSTLAGWQGRPSLSPDGNSIAFHYASEKSPGAEVFAKVIGDERALRLTNSPPSFCPSWSPNSQTIAYSHTFDENPGKRVRAIMMMTYLGGSHRIIRRTSPEFRFCKISWSPDGKLLAYSDDEIGQPSGIFVMSTNGEAVRRVTTAPANTTDGDPSFSPDGQQVAFVRETSIYASDIYVVSAFGGEPTRLTFLNAGVWSPAWTPDGRKLLFSLGGYVGGIQAVPSSESAPLTSGLYIVPLTGGPPERLPLPQTNIMNPVLSSRGDIIAYEKHNFILSIWKLSLLEPKEPPRKFLATTTMDNSPQFSPDGRQIVFASLRDGTQAIWIAEADGENPSRLTTLQMGGSPDWSPDGTHIVFDDRVKDRMHLHFISLRDHNRQQLTDGDFDDWLPVWAHDRQSIYFASNRTGRPEIWKLLLRTQEAVQVTYDGGDYPQEAPDGSFVYYNKVRDDSDAIRELWRVPATGGKEERLIAEADQNWRVRPEGIYFATMIGRPKRATEQHQHQHLHAGDTPDSELQPVLKLYAFATGKKTVVGMFAKPLALNGRNLAISPNGHDVLYAQYDASSNDVMVAKSDGRW